MVANAFVLCKVRHSVSLSPCHAVEPRVGIEQDLTEQLMRYSEPLQGVVLSFSNVKLDRPHGVIVNEMPFIHCKVLADALLFRPKEGMKLRGIVNKIGSNHVGMLFAGVFNGSVAEAELPKGYVHNYAQDCWLGEDGSSISVEDEVEVKVLRVHVAGAMVAIEATMRFDGANVVKAASTTKLKKPLHLNLAAEEPEATPVKEKKAKKTKKVVEAEKPAVLNLAADEPVKEKKSKKSKKTVEVEKPTVLDLAADKPVKEKKSKKPKKVVETDTNDVKSASSKKTKKLYLAADEPVKEKKSKKTKTAVEAEAVVVVKEKKDKKKIKKRKHETPVEEVAEEVAASVEPKKYKHKDKDAKKKKHKKSKHE